jgi:hypothetical protein
LNDKAEQDRGKSKSLESSGRIMPGVHTDAASYKHDIGELSMRPLRPRSGPVPNAHDVIFVLTQSFIRDLDESRLRPLSLEQPKRAIYEAAV